MRTTKSSDRFANKLDHFFWFFIKLMPFFAYVFSFFLRTSGGYTNFPGFFLNYFLSGGSFSDNIVWQCLYSLFGPGGVFPYFSSETALYVFTWIIWVEIFHVFFDVIVFIPRIAHKFISKAVQDD